VSRDWLWRGWVAAVLLAGCTAATTKPHADSLLAMRYEKGVEAFDLDSLVARAPPGPVAVVDLGRTAWFSHHVAIVREGEVPHYHRFHDLTVVVLRGEGIMEIEGRRIALKAGDVAYVQRGVRHHFRNTGKDLAAAFITFSPPFDGRDTVTSDVPAEKAPEPAEKAPEPAPPKPKSWWHFWGGEEAKPAPSQS
jgi:mannose-6-phosphate isomerase-like protein (cupin superfamily)